MSLQGHWRKFTVLVMFSLATLVLYMMYVCNNGLCNMTSIIPKSIERSFGSRTDGEPDKRRRSRFGFSIKESIKKYNFTTSGGDVVVFLHIQKTGGTTFGKHLVRNLKLEHPCKCPQAWPKVKCSCNIRNSKKIWLFSRYSIGWPCGLHADWTELSECVPGYITKRNGPSSKRRFLYVTFLREPFSRVISEFLCYQRGTTWATAAHKCNGRTPTMEELPPCFTGDNWMDVTLDEFMNCTSNLAFNRQARMLADLKLVNCYNITNRSRRKRGKIMLKSAMRNLKNMAYFGLTEYQKESQYLFERTFGIKFMKPFRQRTPEETRAADAVIDISTRDMKRIRYLNAMDLRLYAFAKDLFFYRLKYFQEQDKSKE